jgi:signal transduction histidine kinase
MKSLQARLLCAMLLALALLCALWLGLQWRQQSLAQARQWDASISQVGMQMLLTLPVDIEVVAGGRTAQLPPSAGFVGEPVSYQVWLRGTRLALRSPGSPEGPLKRDFRDGFSDEDHAGQRWRVYAVTDRSGTLQVQMGKPYAALAAELHRWQHLSLLVGLAVFGVLALTTWAVIRWSLAPVQALRQAMLARSGLDTRPLAPRGLPGELVPLVEAFNQLLQQLEAAWQAERRFLGDAAHELRTPLAALINQAQLALGARTVEEQKAAILELTAVARRNVRLAEQLLDVARLDAGAQGQPARRLDLAELVMLVLKDLEGAAAAREQTVQVRLEPSAVQGHVDWLGVLIRNLLDNAIRHAPGGGQVQVRCGLKAGEGGGDGLLRVCLEVHDSGPGVPAAYRQRIFERFYRLPGAASPGSGIGLSLVRRIADLHAAELEVGESPLGGLRVMVLFAAAPEPVA